MTAKRRSSPALSKSRETKKCKPERILTDDEKVFLIDSSSEEEIKVKKKSDFQTCKSTPIKRPLSALPSCSLPSPIASTSKLPMSGSSELPSAFKILMSSKEEEAAWRAAEISERPISKGGKRLAPGQKRKPPFYKIMTGMPICVDGFRYGKIEGIAAYCLSHAHSDHYTNMSSSWKHGPVYCSHTTAEFIKLVLKVPEEFVKPLPYDVPTVLPGTGGVSVTLIDANHCPGSTLFLFEGRQTVNISGNLKSPWVGSSKEFRYLHCGDFRASPRHTNHPSISGKHIDTCYLDTTYLNPCYSFPPQSLVIKACADLAKSRIKGVGVPAEVLEATGEASLKSWLNQAPKVESKTESVEDHLSLLEEPLSSLQEESLPENEDWIPEDLTEDVSHCLSSPAAVEEKASFRKILVVVGTYTIGKERIAKSIAQALDSNIFADHRKRSILGCVRDDEVLRSLISDNPFESQVHIVPLGIINFEGLETYLAKFKGAYNQIVGFRPTGWTYKTAAGTDLNPSIDWILKRDGNKSFTEADLFPGKGSTRTVTLYNVPYSEHSSFFELTAFALSFDWSKMIATVNVGSEKSRNKMQKWFEKWAEARRKREKSMGSSVVIFRHPDYW